MRLLFSAVQLGSWALLGAMASGLLGPAVGVALQWLVIVACSIIAAYATALLIFFLTAVEWR